MIVSSLACLSIRFVRSPPVVALPNGDLLTEGIRTIVSAPDSELPLLIRPPLPSDLPTNFRD